MSYTLEKRQLQMYAQVYPVSHIYEGCLHLLVCVLCIKNYLNFNPFYYVGDVLLFW